MPRLFWYFVAFALIFDRYGCPGALCAGAVEVIGQCATGFYEAWRADMKKPAEAGSDSER